MWLSIQVHVESKCSKFLAAATVRLVLFSEQSTWLELVAFFEVFSGQASPEKKKKQSSANQEIVKITPRFSGFPARLDMHIGRDGYLVVCSPPAQKLAPLQLSTEPGKTSLVSPRIDARFRVLSASTQCVLKEKHAINNELR